MIALILAVVAAQFADLVTWSRHPELEGIPWNTGNPAYVAAAKVIGLLAVPVILFALRRYPRLQAGAAIGVLAFTAFSVGANVGVMAVVR